MRGYVNMLKVQSPEADYGSMDLPIFAKLALNNQQFYIVRMAWKRTKSQKRW